MRNIILPLFLFLFGQCVFSLDTFKIFFLYHWVKQFDCDKFCYSFLHILSLAFVELLGPGGSLFEKFFGWYVHKHSVCLITPILSLRTLVTHTFDHLSLPYSVIVLNFLLLVFFSHSCFILDSFYCYIFKYTTFYLQCLFSW